MLSHLSSVIRVMRLTRSTRNSMLSLFMAPMVSAAIGTNEYDCVSGCIWLSSCLFIIISSSKDYNDAKTDNDHYRDVVHSTHKSQT